MEFGLVQSFGRAAVVGIAVLSVASVAGAAVVHFDPLPSGINPSFSRGTHAYMYLEGETSTQGASDTFTSAADATRTFYRTGANPSDFWGSAAVYDGARYANRGADSTFTGINTYWENLATGLQEGQYDVFVRAQPGASGSQTFSIYAGADRSAVDSAAASGTVTTNGPGIARWYKIGTVDLAAGMDTFRLKTDTSTSTVRFDAVLFAGPPVPEPATGLLAVAGVFALASRRRRAVR